MINRQYFKISAKTESEIEKTEYEKRVLQKNKIEGLIPFQKRYMNGEAFYYYIIEGLHSMIEVFEGASLSAEDMDSFVECLREVLSNLKEYLLKQEQLCLKPECIMYDKVKQKWRFLYMVESYDNQGHDLIELMDFFMGLLGTDVEKENWFYEYYTDLLQFADNITPKELVNMWNRNENILLNKGIDERQFEEEGAADKVEGREEVVLQNGISNDLQSCEEIRDLWQEKHCGWRERWNRISYARLYLVPFMPEH